MSPYEPQTVGRRRIRIASTLYGWPKSLQLCVAGVSEGGTLMTCIRPPSQNVSTPHPTLDENMITHLSFRLFNVAIAVNLKRNGGMNDLASGPQSYQQ